METQDNIIESDGLAKMIKDEVDRLDTGQLLLLFNLLSTTHRVQFIHGTVRSGLRDRFRILEGPSQYFPKYVHNGLPSV